MPAEGWGRTAMGWPINPNGLEAVLLDLKERYDNPRMYVTENGCALEETPDIEGFVSDWARVDYLRAHILALHNALREGANVGGYYAWSLLDNFEWASGYQPRFGLVHVDFDSGKRTPKRSAAWYRSLIARNELEE
jgi:beta-glucosidase